MLEEFNFLFHLDIFSFLSLLYYLLLFWVHGLFQSLTTIQSLILVSLAKLPFSDLEETAKEISTFLHCGLAASSLLHMHRDLSLSSGAASLPC